MQANRREVVADLYTNDGPSDGEDDFDEELEAFLLEIKLKVDKAIQMNRNNLFPLVKTIRNKLVEENYIFNLEFYTTGMLEFLLKMLGEEIYDQHEFVSNIFEILGMISVSSSIRDKILDFNDKYFNQVVATYFSHAHGDFFKNLLFFLANFVCEPEYRDIVTNQISYFSFIKIHNTRVAELLQDKDMALEYLRFISNLLST